MSKIILGLVGEFAAGKGTVAKYLREKNGAASFRFSDPLREVLDLYDLEKSRVNMQEISTLLRQHFGENVLAKAMAKRVRSSADRFIIIDGVRRFTDIENLRTMPEFKLIYVSVPPEIRHQRYVMRNENPGDNVMTYEQFLAKHGAEADKQVPEVAKTADFVLDNAGGVEELYQKVDEVISQLSV